MKTLVQDLWDRREAKLRTSIVKFLSQKNVSHARLDYVQPTEVVAARPTLAACKQIARLVANIHDSQQSQAWVFSFLTNPIYLFEINSLKLASIPNKERFSKC